MTFYVKSLQLISYVCIREVSVFQQCRNIRHYYRTSSLFTDPLYSLQRLSSTGIKITTAGDLWTPSATGGGGEKRKFLFFLTLHAPSCSLALVLHCNEQAIQLGEDEPTGKSIEGALTLDTRGKLQEFYLTVGGILTKS